MNSFDTTGRLRSVVPRWRSFLNTSTAELIPAARFPNLSPITGAAFNDLIKLWTRSGKLEDHVDLMDAGLASGSRFLATQGARRIIANAKDVRPRILSRAEAILFGRRTFVTNSSAPFDEVIQKEVHRKIKNLRLQYRESPRNHLVHLELARLYARLAQFGSAERHVRIALSLTPNDRFALRAATRFFTAIGQQVEALMLLRRSAALQYDPWVQSAELATAVLAGRASRSEARARTLLNSGRATFETSELTIGLLSKQFLEGENTRKTVRRLKGLLSQTTENALAQGVWLTDTMHTDFIVAFPEIRPSSDAHEAKSILLGEQARFAEAANEANLWFADQPFQARSALHLSYLNFTHLGDYNRAREAAEAGLLLHPDDPDLLNAGVIASIFCGDLERATVLLKRLEKEGIAEDQKPFLLAAKGMLSFELGHSTIGLGYYRDAALAAQKIKRTDLAVTAAIFLFEMTSRQGKVSVADMSRFEEKLTLSLKRLSPVHRNSVERVWKSRKLAIADFSDRLDFGSEDKSKFEFDPILGLLP